MFRIWTDCCGTGMCWTKHFAKANLKYLDVPDTSLLFLKAKKIPTSYAQSRVYSIGITSATAETGPLSLCSSGQAHAQLCAKGCFFFFLRPTDTTYARLHKTNTTPWENMTRLSLSSICFDLSCVTGPPLYCTNQPLYIYANIFH